MGENLGFVVFIVGSIAILEAVGNAALRKRVRKLEYKLNIIVEELYYLKAKPPPSRMFDTD